jgi:hypothetical protein
LHPQVRYVPGDTATVAVATIETPLFASHDKLLFELLLALFRLRQSPAGALVLPVHEGLTALLLSLIRSHTATLRLRRLALRVLQSLHTGPADTSNATPAISLVPALLDTLQETLAAHALPSTSTSSAPADVVKVPVAAAKMPEAATMYTVYVHCSEDRNQASFLNLLLGTVRYA